MKTPRLFILVFALQMSAVTLAQDNIKKAFDEFKSVKAISKTFVIYSDEEDKENISKSMTYTFTISSKKIGAITNVVSAFEKSADDAYAHFVKIGDNPTNTKVIKIDNVKIGVKHFSNYYLSCFNDKADTTGNYRHAYAIEWTKNDDEISGFLYYSYGVKPPKQKGLKGVLNSISNLNDVFQIQMNDLDLQNQNNLYANLDSLNKRFPFSEIGMSTKKSDQTFISILNDLMTVINLNRYAANQTAGFHVCTKLYQKVKDNVGNLSEDERAICVQQISSAVTGGKIGHEMSKELLLAAVAILKK
ncbi:MAG: hypothetical protein IKA00_00505 [Prevotella sp.]|nr:hypothetical protein [Prevotella sp.]